MIELRALAPFASRPPAPQAARCELCGGSLGDRHRHVIELGTRGVQCTCHACALLFGGSATRYRAIPDRVRRDRAFALSRARLVALGIPVALAICYRDSTRDCRVVCYPGPAGLAEAELEGDAWSELAAATPLAAELADDVEALLVRGDRGATALACYLVPISAAYELIGRLRGAWQGFTGGAEADAELARFFEGLDREATP